MADSNKPRHKNARNDLAADYVRSLFLYDEETGNLIWQKVGKGNPRKFGDIAGSRTKSGHIRLGIKGNLYLAHRIIWLIKTGEWPEFEIDHVDMDGVNNRWKNLREATTAQNQRNRGAIKNTKSGFKGVSFHRGTGKYAARIRSKEHGGLIHLGVHDTPEQAHKAYVEAAQRIHGEFHRA